MLRINELFVERSSNFSIGMQDTNIEKACFVALTGCNGSGKSSLISGLLNFISCVKRDIKLFDRDLSEQEIVDNVSYMPQQQMVELNFPISAIDVVAMGLFKEYGHFGSISDEIYNRILSVLDDFAIRKYAHSRLDMLSCGQQQKVFFARAIMKTASVYIFDEPFSMIDVDTKNFMIERMQIMAREMGKIIICVCHEDDFTPFDMVYKVNAGVVEKFNV